MALSYESLSNFDEAFNYSFKALDIYKKIYINQNDHPDISLLCNNIGKLNYSLGLYDKALENYSKSLFLRLNYHTKSSQNVNFKYIFDQLNLKFEDLEYASGLSILFETIIANLKEGIHDSLFHSDVALSLTNIGLVLAKQSFFDKALFLHQSSLKIREKIYDLNSNHNEISACHANIGHALYRMQKNNDAEKHYKKALVILMRNSNSDEYSNEIALRHNDLGNIAREKQQLKLSKFYFLLSMKMMVEIHKDSLFHEDVAMVLCNLGSVYVSLQQFPEAIKMNKLAISILNVVYNKYPYHSDIISNYINLGNAYRYSSMYQKSEDSFLKALEKYQHEDNNNKDIHLIGKILNNLAGLYADQNDFLKAYSILKNCFEMLLAVYDNDFNNPSLSIYAYNFATISQKIAFDCFKKGEFVLSSNYAEEAKSYLAPKPELLGLINLIIKHSMLQKMFKSIISDQPAFGHSVLNVFRTANSENSNENLIKLIFSTLDELDLLHSEEALINAHLALLKLDPALQHGNHYHNLGCYYSANGNIDKANDAFTKGLEETNHFKSNLQAEYAQFLILNKGVLSIYPNIISKHLYEVIYGEDDGSALQYGKIEKNSVCKKLKELVEQNKTTITINPKALAYHLLITNPEYIVESGDAVESTIKNLIEDFRTLTYRQKEEHSSSQLFQSTLDLILNTNGELHITDSLTSSIVISLNTETDSVIDDKNLLGGTDEYV